MKSIGNFLDKFNSVSIREINKRSLIINIIKKESKVDLKIENISIKGSDLRIISGSIEKNQIFLKKDKIIKEINSRVSNLVLKDIK